jgi:hypothetical protein
VSCSPFRVPIARLAAAQAALSAHDDKGAATKAAGRAPRGRLRRSRHALKSRSRVARKKR